MASIGVADAADVLGVSERRVRRMLADGALPGQRVGRLWVLDAEVVRQAASKGRDVGRPWIARSAWAVLALADGMEVELSPVQRSRAMNRMKLGLGAVRHRLDVRAERQQMYGHPGVLGRLADDPSVVASGVSAAARYGADLLPAEEFEGYVRSSHFGAVEARFGLIGQSERPNVVLRVVDDAEWPFPAGMEAAGPAVVAVDLLESDDPRVRRAGQEMLERL